MHILQELFLQKMNSDLYEVLKLLESVETEYESKSEESVEDYAAAVGKRQKIYTFVPEGRERKQEIDSSITKPE